MKTGLSRYLPDLILASASPGRRKLLEEEGIRLTIEPTRTDEDRKAIDTKDAVLILSKRKMETYLREYPHPLHPVLTSDTLVRFQGNLVGKPKDRDDASRMLHSFSGNGQEVESGWCLFKDGRVLSGMDRAIVRFRNLDEKAIASYLDSGEWEGAAGAYRIQGMGKALIASIDGDFSTVVGLPLLQISAILSGIAFV